MRTVGKFLQVAGLVVLPMACLLELQSSGLGRPSGVATMLLMMVCGAAAFAVGRIVEGYAR